MIENVRSTASARPAGIIASLLVATLLASPAALAQTNTCAAPGIELLTDPEGDWSGTVGGFAEQGAGLPEQDLLGVSAWQTDAASGVLLHIRIKVAAGSTQLPPTAAWYTSFQSPDGGVMGVRLQTDETGAASYFSYAAGESNAGTRDGRFVEAGSEVPAVEGSGPDGEGNIDIVVKADDVGVYEYGDDIYLTGFNAATVQSVPEGLVAFTIDEAPTLLARGDNAYQVVAPGACGGAKSGSGALMGGSLGLALLAPFGLAAWRRRAARG